MSITNEQRAQINRLITHRDQITSNLFYIEQIIKQYFPEEFEIAYQHWIPQISTALFHDKKWLPRGEQTLEDTIQRLIDKTKEKTND